MCTVKTLKVPCAQRTARRAEKLLLSGALTTDSFNRLNSVRERKTNHATHTFNNIHGAQNAICIHSTLRSGSSSATDYCHRVCLIMHTHLCFAQHLECTRSHIIRRTAGNPFCRIRLSRVRELAGKFDGTHTHTQLCEMSKLAGASSHARNQYTAIKCNICINS